jgi:hypothetical protein
VSTSQNKEGAWEFIKYRILNESQYVGEHSPKFLPVTVSALNKQLEYDMKLFYYFKYAGGAIYSSNPIPEEKREGYDIEIIPAEEDEKAFLNFINTADAVQKYDRQLWDILYEEIWNYLGTDNRTAAEAAEIIQSRASIYISEGK